jgi:hypothetical protein
LPKSVDAPAPEPATPCAGEAGIVSGDMILALAQDAQSQPGDEDAADRL